MKIINKYKIARWRRQFLFWLMGKIAKSLGDEGTKELRYLAWKVEFKEAQEGFRQFKSVSNKGKTLFEALSTEDLYIKK